MYFHPTACQRLPTFNQVEFRPQVLAGPEERGSPIVQVRQIVSRRQPIIFLDVTKTWWQITAKILIRAKDHLPEFALNFDRDVLRFIDKVKRLFAPGKAFEI